MTVERRVREIDISGVDEDGVLCRWTGFDKETGKFWGRPIDCANGNCQPTRLTENGQKDTIKGKGRK